MRLSLTLLALLPVVAGCNWPSPAKNPTCSAGRLPTAPAGALKVDGDPSDWTAAGIAPLLTRTAGTPVKSGSFRVDAFYAAVDGSALFLRIDGAPPEKGSSGNAELAVYLKTLGDMGGQLSFQAPGSSNELCGDKGQKCCALNTCHNGGCCMNGNCLAQGTPCGNDAVCQNGSCGTCGGEGQSCCQWLGNSCTAGAFTCPNPSKGCVPCGAAGQPCCGNDPVGCEPSLTCSGDACTVPKVIVERQCCDSSGCPGGDNSAWRCNANWWGNNGPGPSMEGYAAGTYTAGSVVVEARIATKSFGAALSLYPVAEHPNYNCSSDCPPNVPDDDIGCVWFNWPPAPASP